MKLRQYLPYLALIGLFLILLSPDLMTDGMFMDGLWYAAISNNLAEGIGSFWKLRFTETMYYEFYEHPPLAMGIQSIFYTLFGSSLYLERIYSLLCFIVNGWIMIHIWKAIKGSRKGAWLALLCWILIPLVFWSASNNILENTMMLFTSTSVLFFIKAYQSPKKWLYLLGAALAIVLAVLTKGLVGLFPLAFPLWYYLFKDRQHWYKMFLDGFYVLLSVLLIFGMIFVFFPGSFDSLQAYFFKQIVRSVQIIVTVDSRFYIVQRLFLELIPTFIILLVMIFISKKKPQFKSINPWSWILLSVGFSGVLPIMVSLKQSGFYMLAALPFFPLALSLMFQNNFDVVVERWKNKIGLKKGITSLSFLLFAVGLGLNILQMGKIGRDKEVLEDVYTLITVFQERDENIIGLDPQLSVDWTLSGYFQRYGYIALDPEQPQAHEYLLLPKSSSFDTTGYYKIDMGLKTLDLFQSKDSHQN